jgi:4-hydroxy-tetrahydrodipicolinate synthase
MIELIGAMTALVTPMKNGGVDHETYAKLIQRQIDNGIDIVVPVGTTGESATLTHEEHRACIETAVRVCKGTNTKVLAGAGSNATAEAVSLAKFAQEAGADAILAVTPYYNKPTQEGLYQHYKAIAASVDIPVMLYNVPGRTAVDMEADTVIRLFDDCNNITAIKEATGSMERCVELLAKRPELIVISGDDAINYPLMANGAKGTISVTANLLPNMISELVHKALEGDLIASKKVNDELYTINSAMFCESNPIPVKASMQLAGLMPTLEYRLPLVAPSGDSIETLKTAMKNYKIAE